MKMNSDIILSLLHAGKQYKLNKEIGTKIHNFNDPTVPTIVSDKPANEITTLPYDTENKHSSWSNRV